MDGQAVVLGYAFPGLEDSLCLNQYKPTEDVDLPDFVEVTAQVQNFELEFTATVVTNGLFRELEEDDLATRGSGQLYGRAERCQQGSWWTEPEESCWMA